MKTSGVPDSRLLKHVEVTLLGRGAFRAAQPVAEGGLLMDVLLERVAGLDAGKEIVVVCVRSHGQGGRRVSETRHRLVHVETALAELDATSEAHARFSRVRGSAHLVPAPQSDIAG